MNGLLHSQIMGFLRPKIRDGKEQAAADLVGEVFDRKDAGQLDDGYLNNVKSRIGEILKPEFYDEVVNALMGMLNK